MSFRYPLLLLGLVASGLLGQSIRHAAVTGVIPFWPSTGVALAAMLLTGPRAAWIIGAAAFATSAPWRGVPFAAVLGIVDAMSVLLAWALLQRIRDFNPRLAHRRDVIAFLVGGVIVTTTSMATATTLYRCLSGLRPWEAFWPTWFAWWMGNLSGALVAAPPLLLWSRGWWRELRISGRRAEAVLIYGLLAVNSVATVSLNRSVPGLVLHHLLPLPLLLWASLRFGRFGAPSAVVLIALSGVFSLIDGPAPAADLWRLWAFTVSLAGAGMLVTALEAERGVLVRRHTAIIRALGEIVYDHDVPRRRVEWNGEIERVLGHTAERMGTDASGWTDRVHPDDEARVARDFEDAQATRRVFDCEYRLRRRDGTYIWVHDRGTLMYDEHDRLARVVGVLRDVSARHESDEALRASEERFRIAATFGSDVIYEWDLVDNRLLRFGRVQQVLGDDSDGVAGSREAWEQMLHPDDRQRVLAAVAGQIERGEPFAADYRLVRPDGAVLRIADRGLAIRDSTGRAVKWIGVMTDVTRQRQLEDQLRQAQKMESVGQLAGGVAHDFNNLLQVIQGYTIIATDPALAAAEREAALTQVQLASDRAAQLTRQLLAFGRRQPMQMCDTDVAELVSHLLKMVRRLIGEHIEVRLITGGAAGNVRCDRAQIEQVVLNLCVNARDAMPGGGRLTLSVEDVTVSAAQAESKPGMRRGRYVRLQVSDTGTGMDRETRRRMFEPFFTTKPEGHGTGLGLAVAYGLVKQHEGYIDVESEVGRGSAFSIYLPVVARKQEAATDRERGIDLTSDECRGRILLAEDEPAVRDLARAVLERAGYEVLTACDGEEALRLFREGPERVQLAILDAVMPRLGGADVGRQMRAERPDVRLLICSGYPGHELQTMMDPGEHHFMAKPYRPRDLLERVRLLLAS